METQSGFGLGGTTREPEVGFGLGEGRRPLLEGVNLLPPEELDPLKSGAKAALLRTKALGQNLGILIGAGFSSVWNHKLELATGMIASGATKAAVRAALTGSGAGIATLAMVGAVGGAVGGAAKEYAKQSKDITLADESRKLLVGFFINEYHKLPQVDKGKVGKAALKGAAFGAAGAVIGGFIADNEWVQDKIYAAGDWVREQAANLPKPDIRLPQFGSVPGSVQETTPPIEADLGEIITIPANSNVSDVQKIFSEHVKEALGREVLPYEVERVAVDFSKIAEMSSQSSEPEIIFDVKDFNEFINNTLRSETYDFQFNKPYDLGRKLSEYININLSYEPSTLEVEKASELILSDNPDLSDQLDLADSEGREVVLKVNFHTLNDAIREARVEGRGLFPDLAAGSETTMAAELPAGKDVIELPSGSNPWNETEKYFVENLGRKPSVPELIEATTRVVHDSNISDSAALPAGYQLDLSSLNTYLQEVAAEKLPVSFDVESLPPVMELPSGSSPWNMSEELGRVALGGEQPSAGTIAQITKALCLDNNISVPEWGIEGEIPADKIRAGSKFILGPLTKQALTKISS